MSVQFSAARLGPAKTVLAVLTAITVAAVVAVTAAQGRQCEMFNKSIIFLK